MAITLASASSNAMVRIPGPGPTSTTLSPDFTPDASMIFVIISGLIKKFWPRLLLVQKLFFLSQSMSSVVFLYAIFSGSYAELFVG